MNPWLQMNKNPEQAMRNQIEMQRQGLVDQERDLASMANFTPQMDLSALASLTDQWTGSNFAKNYQRPETAADRFNAVNAEQARINKDRMGLNQADLDLLKSQTASEDKALDRDARRHLLKDSLDAKAGKAKELKQFQYTAALYGKRAEDAYNHYEDVVSDKYDPKTGQKTPGYDPTTRTAALDASGFGKALEFSGLRKVSPDQKKINQAQVNFIMATLRPETGATIKDSELADALQIYFGTYGNSKEVLEQKRLARQRLVEGLKSKAGPAYDEYTKSDQTAAAMQDAPANTKSKKPTYEEWLKEEGL